MLTDRERRRVEQQRAAWIEQLRGLGNLMRGTVIGVKAASFSSSSRDSKRRCRVVRPGRLEREQNAAVAQELKPVLAARRPPGSMIARIPPWLRKPTAKLPRSMTPTHPLDSYKPQIIISSG